MADINNIAITLALLSAILYSGSDSLANLLSKRKKDPATMNFMQAAIGLSITAPIAAFTWQITLTVEAISYVVCSALVFSIASYALFKTFQTYSLAIGSAIIAAAPLITLIISPILGIQENITLLYTLYVLVITILIISLELSTQPKSGRKNFSKTKWPLISMILYGSGTAMLAKIFNNQYTNPTTYAAILFTITLLFFTLIIKPNYSLIKDKKSVKVLLYRTMFVVAGDYALFYAIKHYTSVIALIEAIHESSVVFSVIIGIIFFKDKHSITQYVLMIALVIVLFLLYFI